MTDPKKHSSIFARMAGPPRRPAGPPSQEPGVFPPAQKPPLLPEKRREYRQAQAKPSLSRDGKVAGVAPGGRLYVSFPRDVVPATGGTFEVYKRVQSNVVSLGTGTLSLAGPGVYLLEPSSGGFVQPKVGDGVRAYGG